MQTFQYAFEKEFKDGVVKEYEKNHDFYGRILKDEEFRDKLMRLMMYDVYNSFKNPSKEK